MKSLLALALLFGICQPVVAATWSFWGTNTVPTKPADPDTASVELGLRFTSSVAGTVKGVRFYKGSGNIGTHTGSLWDSAGKRIAGGTFRRETATGWQTLMFAAPVPIGASKVYTISYHAPRGHYAGDNNFFASPLVNGPLTALAPGNGVYRYGIRAFPTQTFQSSNYWVDVIVETANEPPPPPPPPPPNPSDTIGLGENANLNGFLPFPANNPWNQDISGEPVDPDSAAMTVFVCGWCDAGLKADFGSGLYAGAKIGIPYTVVPEGQALVPINFGSYASESDPGPYPVPPNAPIESDGVTGYADRHVLVVQRDPAKANQMGRLYELFRAYPNGSYPTAVSSWEAEGGATFDLNSNALRPEKWTSADAAGLPIFPGLIRYEEILAGEIRHAIRFTLTNGYTRRGYVHPATHAAGGGGTGSPYVPFGAKFRLKADYNISGFPPEVRIMLTAMKKYGLILADNGGNYFISGAPDPRWNNDNLRYFGYLRITDFDVVQMGTVYPQ